MGPNSRSTFLVDTPVAMRSMFENRGYESHYFSTADGEQFWEDFVAESREVRSENVSERSSEGEPEYVYDEPGSKNFLLEEVSGESYDESGGFTFEEEPGEEEFVFGEEPSHRHGLALATLPPDAPVFSAGSSATQDALIGGIPELVDAVKGLSLDGVRTNAEETAAPVVRTVEPQEHEKVVSAADEETNARIKELYETIDELRRQNMDLKRSLEAAEAAPPQPAPEPEWETPTPVDKFGEEPEEEDPWAVAWRELAASVPAEETSETPSSQDAWDLEPVPPTAEDIAEQERLAAEVEDIITRSANLILGMTVLERMAADGETVREITLDELIAQIKSEEKR